MAPHHDDRERHGSHPLVDFDVRERHASEDTAERLEMDRTTAAAPLIPFSWAGIKELGYVVSVVVGMSAGYYGLKADNEKLSSIVEAVSVRVTLIERSRADVLPKFEESLRSNALQDQRIQNITEANARTALSVIELGKVVADQGRVVSEDHTKLAVMEERTARGVPHDR